ncbi:collagen-like repeat preface domain-containing protein, partial [Cellulomonas fimi]|uniref:hypothetical protein n=1 Tax=Cellulomonas fimi TaxID=1708 RepID=UPI0017DC2389
LATVDATGRPSPLAFLPPVLAVLIGIGQWVAESTTGATVGGATGTGPGGAAVTIGGATGTTGALGAT